MYIYIPTNQQNKINITEHSESANSAKDNHASATQYIQNKRIAHRK